MTLWSERHQLMLRAMGLRLWAPEALPPSSAPKEPTLAEPALAGETTVALRSSTSTASLSKAPPNGQPVQQQSALPSDTAAGLPWAALRSAVAGCTACALSTGRSQTVFGGGHPQAHWFFVGDAPGAEEDAAGEPFVGSAGQLLDGMLGALGLTRSADGDPAQSAYLTTSVKCKPPSSRSPLAAEIDCCTPFLRQQIERVQPKIIVVMGRQAAQALLRSDAPLGRLRGQVHRVNGRPLVVTYPLSTLIRSPLEKAKTWADLCLAVHALNAHQ